MNTLARITVGAVAALMGALSGQGLPDPAKLAFRDGTDRVPDRATYKRLSYQGPDVLIDTGLRGVEYIKYQFEGLDTDAPQLYFINTKTHRAHMMFMRSVGIRMNRRGFGSRGVGGPVKQMRGVLAYRPFLTSPGGEPGLYTIEYEPNDAFTFEMVKKSIDLLGAKAPFTKGRIAYYPIGRRAAAQYEKDKQLYAQAAIPIFFPKDVYKDISFLPLNVAEGFGRLRVMQPGERPTQRDVVLYPTLPNEMPRVAGVITEVRQTPLSHVNLRAVQDGVPNAFVKNARRNPLVAGLVGKFVHYKVAPDGFRLRAATKVEVETHFAALRPKSVQVPRRDLTRQAIQGLDDLGFGDWPSVGVKAANIAALRKLGMPEGTVPDGYAVPFHFYEAFMKHNGLFAAARATLAEPAFSDARKQRKALSKLRKRIRKATMPEWMQKALTEMHARLPKGTGIRCRSSTNNEDLPGFSGAGLYDSFTHRPDEGHIEKSIKQVYASLWNFRAFEERAFYRIDHFATSMAVLCHPNYDDEKANGVAVSDDIVYQSGNNYYVNAQVGEDLVTNPDPDSAPEELLLSPYNARDDKVVQTSTRTKDGALILSKEHRDELRKHLGRIKRKFRRHYGRKRSAGKFAMEVEFKVTAAGKLVIKQARPWVYGS